MYTAAVNMLEGALRSEVHAAAPPGTYALVGGTTPVFADIQCEVACSLSSASCRAGGLMS